MPIPAVINVPLEPDEHGTIRVGGSRVTLESVIADYHRGATPEKIVQDFPVLNVADVYHVIGYYLDNRADVDAYIQRQHEEGQRLRHEWESEHPPTLTREVLEGRLEAKRRRSHDR